MLVKKAAISAVLIGVCVAFGGGNVIAKEKSTVVKSTAGSASWYGGQFHGRKTANGERFNMNGLTAAHRSLPFGTKVRVTNQKNGKSVVVRINDRGPFVGKRVIDLSRGAANAVGMLGTGVAKVKLDVLS
jgi:rare lipoprotein A